MVGNVPDPRKRALVLIHWSAFSMVFLFGCVVHRNIWDKSRFLERGPDRPIRISRALGSRQIEEPHLKKAQASSKWGRVVCYFPQTPAG